MGYIYDPAPNQTGDPYFETRMELLFGLSNQRVVAIYYLPAPQNIPTFLSAATTINLAPAGGALAPYPPTATPGVYRVTGNYRYQDLTTAGTRGVRLLADNANVGEHFTAIDSDGRATGTFCFLFYTQGPAVITLGGIQNAAAPLALRDCTMFIEQL